MTNQSARRAILDTIAADIRRVAPGQSEVTLPVALENWNYFFQQGRYKEAAIWWNAAHQRIAQGSN